MDVHPIKNVSIGIDPYPYVEILQLPFFSGLKHDEHVAISRSSEKNQRTPSSGWSTWRATIKLVMTWGCFMALGLPH